MMTLLKKSDNVHLRHWFQIALDLYESSRASKSYAKTLGAYDGMGNDVFWSLPLKEHKRLEHLKGAFWTYTKMHS